MCALTDEGDPQQGLEQLDPEDEKLTIAVTRIHRLRAAGLTIEMVGADFLRRRIAPLQNKLREAGMGVKKHC